MIELQGRATRVIRGTTAAPRIFRLSEDSERPGALRKGEGYLSRKGDAPEGFAWHVFIGGDASPPGGPTASQVHLPGAFDHLRSGDVLRVTEKGDVTVLFQKAAQHHTFLLTERCNHYCLMCSQPPRDVQDDWLVDDIMNVIPLIDRATPEVLFTGGEPTLLGSRLLTLVRQCKSYLPETALHILTNGRAFKDNSYAEGFARIAHHDLMFGIPIYSDQSQQHDFIVQADGAFDETIRAILNLKRNDLQVEIRVVVHRQSYERLPQLAQFIARNLTFVEQVVFMGLEITGFTRANLETLWIEPLDYQPELVEAVQLLADSRIHTSVYNHQLCVTDRAIWPFARRSISDWKNEYMPECASCDEKDSCGGFFSSAKLRYSDHIRAIRQSGVKAI